MNAPRAPAGLLMLLTAACAALPAKHKAAQLPQSVPLESSDIPSGGDWPVAEWWTRYQDPVLDQLIVLGGANSPSLASAHARYDTARQSVRLAAAEAGAHLDAVADADRQRLSDNGLFPPRLLGFTWYNQFDLGLQASYTFDWWGKQRDAVESAIDQAHAAQAERSAAALLLSGSIADAYFGWQSDQNRLMLLKEKERAVESQANITSSRVRAELDSADELNSSDLSLSATREQIAALEGSAKLRIVALAALVGRAPSELPPLVLRRLPSFPGVLPDNVKIDLISRRADITASRWRVEAAEKSLASARADFFPDVSVNALLGLQSLAVSNLLEYGSRVPQISAAVHLPIFEAGRLKARYGAASAAIDSAISSYQDTVISAARDVAAQATTLAQIDAQRRQRAKEIDAALRMKNGAAARVRQGLSDARSELAATESWIDQRDAMLQLDSAALSADVALQRALGGGYESRQTLATPYTDTAAP